MKITVRFIVGFVVGIGPGLHDRVDPLRPGGQECERFAGYVHGAFASGLAFQGLPQGKVVEGIFSGNSNHAGAIHGGALHQAVRFEPKQRLRDRNRTDFKLFRNAAANQSCPRGKVAMGDLAPQRVVDTSGQRGERLAVHM